MIRKADAAGALCEFRLLNAAQPVMVGRGVDPRRGVECDGSGGSSVLSALMEASPSGGTPLCRHVSEVARQLSAIAPSLRASGRKAVLVIATDGESSDGDLAQAMRPLQQLPVSVVVKLCTDESNVRGYWQQIDSVLGIYMSLCPKICSITVSLFKITMQNWTWKYSTI